MRFLRRLGIGKPEPESKLAATERLHAEMSAIETEIAEATETLTDLQKSAFDAMMLADKAIHARDDFAARIHLMEMERQREKIHAITADLKVLRELLDTCHTFMKLESIDASREVNP